ncbi:MAG TPA: thioredoxin domain-containing protein [Rhodocyclaceae bacterium]
MPDSLFNRLAGETSPYLQQHKHNPVAWQPWDNAALEAARRLGRPILLSIGYAACHWCHVMAHESFEDPDVAAVMNRLFVNIKVDREERPDLDQVYQAAHQLLTGRAGGWPLTMFLTPDGMPFFGGTYFPKSRRHSLPGFIDVCERVAAFHRQRGDEIARQNASLRDALDRTLPRPGEPDADALAGAREILLSNFDAENGGFGDAPKFPQPALLSLLFRCGDEAAASAALLTLTRMAAGGVFDQVGGGFFRYSVDARWDVPHFEKMLYDNALLLPLYAEAWRRTREERYLRAADATADWMMREMQAHTGGYFASLDADAEGEEGGYYIWMREEVRALLTAEEWRVAEAAWGLDAPPNFENRAWHLHRTEAPVREDVLEAARAKLLQAREARTRPGRDEKILTAWNALAIAGMARAGRLCERPTWLASARRALDFLRAELWRDGRLLASWKDGQANLPAYLDDHACLLAALLETLQHEYRGDDLDWALALADTLLAHFEDKGGGGFYFTAHDHETLIHRPKPGFDNATPAGNGVAAAALARLGHLLGETRYLEAAHRALEAFGGQLAQPACATLLVALADEQAPPPIVLLRGPRQDVAQWQLRLARNWSGFALGLPNGLALPSMLARPESRGVNAWVCSGVSCLPPIDDFDELARALNPATPTTGET